MEVSKMGLKELREEVKRGATPWARRAARLMERVREEEGEKKKYVEKLS